jgi:hypothetical protein
VTGAATVGLCDAISLDASLSSGIAGRSNAFVWSVAAVNAAANATVANITALLSQAGSVSQVNVPTRLRAAGGVYTFSVSVAHFLFASDAATPAARSIASVSVSVATNPLPLVSIDGPSSVTTPSAQALMLRVRGSLPTCAGADGNGTLSASTKLLYSWRAAAVVDGPVAAAGGLNLTANLSNAAVAAYVLSNPAQIRFPAGTFQLGVSYTVTGTVAVYDILTGLLTGNNSATATVRSLSQGLAASVTGGGRQVGVDVPLPLDASGSSDLDGFAAVPFTYAWTCYNATGMGAAAVASALSAAASAGAASALAQGLPVPQTTASSAGGGSSLMAASVLSASFAPCAAGGGGLLNAHAALQPGTASVRLLPAGALAPGIFLFVVNATKGSLGGVVPNHFRWATASAAITAVSGSPPSVYAVAVVSRPSTSGGGTTTSAASGSVTVSNKDRVQLVGFANATSAAAVSGLAPGGGLEFAYAWAVSPDSLAALPSLRGAKLLLTSVAALTLSIDASLIPALGTVSFSFTATIVDSATRTPLAGGSSTASVAVRKAGPPFGGAVAIFPSAGSAALTRFTVSAVNWQASTSSSTASSDSATSAAADTSRLEYAFGYILGSVAQSAAFLDATTGAVRDITTDDLATVGLVPLATGFSSSPRLEGLLLPRGAPAQNDSVSIVVTVRDTLTGASAVSFMGSGGAPAVASVGPPATSLSGLLAFASAAVAGAGFGSGAGGTGSGSGSSSIATSARSGDLDAVLATTAAIGSVVRSGSLAASAAASACLAVGLDCGSHGECLPVAPPIRLAPVCQCKTGSGYSGPACAVPPTPVNGNYSTWGLWGSCSVSCGGGTQMRARACTASAFGGVPSACEAYSRAQALGDISVPPPALTETRDCNAAACADSTPVDGAYGSWSDWSACNSSCDGRSGYYAGSRFRTRACDSPPPTANGRTCEQQASVIGDAIEYQPCNTDFCYGRAKRCPSSTAALAAAPNPFNLPAVECSGNGVCVRDPVLCTEGQPSCTAVCACIAGYTGSGCALTADELQASRNATLALLGLISDAAAVTDASSDAVSHTVAALATVVASPDDVDAGAATTTLAAVDALLRNSEGRAQAGAAGAAGTATTSRRRRLQLVVEQSLPDDGIVPAGRLTRDAAASDGDCATTGGGGCDSARAVQTSAEPLFFFGLDLPSIRDVRVAGDSPASASASVSFHRRGAGRWLAAADDSTQTATMARGRVADSTRALWHEREVHGFRFRIPASAAAAAAAADSDSEPVQPADSLAGLPQVQGAASPLRRLQVVASASGATTVASSADAFSLDAATATQMLGLVSLVNEASNGVAALTANVSAASTANYTSSGGAATSAQPDFEALARRSLGAAARDQQAGQTVDLLTGSADVRARLARQPAAALQSLELGSATGDATTVVFPAGLGASLQAFLAAASAASSTSSSSPSSSPAAGSSTGILSQILSAAEGSSGQTLDVTVVDWKATPPLSGGFGPAVGAGNGHHAAGAGAGSSARRLLGFGSGGDADAGAYTDSHFVAAEDHAAGVFDERAQLRARLLGQALALLDGSQDPAHLYLKARDLGLRLAPADFMRELARHAGADARGSESSGATALSALSDGAGNAYGAHSGALRADRQMRGLSGSSDASSSGNRADGAGSALISRLLSSPSSLARALHLHHPSSLATTAGRRLAAAVSAVNTTGKVVATNGLLISDVRQGSGVQTIEVGAAGALDPVQLLHAPDPIFFDLSISRDLSPNPAALSCAYFSRAAGVYSDAGTIPVSYRADAASGQLIVTCATTHLSAFRSYVAPYAPTVNAVDPVGDSGLLANYSDPANLFPVIVLAVLLAGFLLAWVVSLWMQRRQRARLQALRRAQLVRFGELRRGFGMDAVKTFDDTAAAAGGKARSGGKAGSGGGAEGGSDAKVRKADGFARPAGANDSGTQPLLLGSPQGDGAAGDAAGRPGSRGGGKLPLPSSPRGSAAASVSPAPGVGDDAGVAVVTVLTARDGARQPRSARPGTAAGTKPGPAGNAVTRLALSSGTQSPVTAASLNPMLSARSPAVAAAPTSPAAPERAVAAATFSTTPGLTAAIHAPSDAHGSLSSSPAGITASLRAAASADAPGARAVAPAGSAAIAGSDAPAGQVASSSSAAAQRVAELEGQLDDAEAELAANARRGTMLLLVRYVWAHFIDGMRRSHSWGSVFTPPLDEQLVNSRPQRVAILIAAMLTAMAFNAAFLGYEPGNVGATVTMTLVSTLLMWPVSDGFPALFEAANSFVSFTRKESEGRRRSVFKKRRASEIASGRRRSSLLLALGMSKPARPIVPGVAGRRLSAAAVMPLSPGAAGAVKSRRMSAPGGLSLASPGAATVASPVSSSSATSAASFAARGLGASEPSSPAAAAHIAILRGPALMALEPRPSPASGTFSAPAPAATTRAAAVPSQFFADPSFAAPNPSPSPTGAAQRAGRRASVVAPASEAGGTSVAGETAAVGAAAASSGSAGAVVATASNARTGAARASGKTPLSVLGRQQRRNSVGPIPSAALLSPAAAAGRGAAGGTVSSIAGSAASDASAGACAFPTATAAGTEGAAAATGSPRASARRSSHAPSASAGAALEGLLGAATTPTKPCAGAAETAAAAAAGGPSGGASGSRGAPPALFTPQAQSKARRASMSGPLSGARANSKAGTLGALLSPTGAGSAAATGAATGASAATGTGAGAPRASAWGASATPFSGLDIPPLGGAAGADIETMQLQELPTGACGAPTAAASAAADSAAAAGSLPASSTTSPGTPSHGAVGAPAGAMRKQHSSGSAAGSAATSAVSKAASRQAGRTLNTAWGAPGSAAPATSALAGNTAPGRGWSAGGQPSSSPSHSRVSSETDTAPSAPSAGAGGSSQVSGAPLLPGNGTPTHSAPSAASPGAGNAGAAQTRHVDPEAAVASLLAPFTPDAEAAQLARAASAAAPRRRSILVSGSTGSASASGHGFGAALTVATVADACGAAAVGDASAHLSDGGHELPSVSAFSRGPSGSPAASSTAGNAARVPARSPHAADSAVAAGVRAKRNSLKQGALRVRAAQAGGSEAKDAQGEALATRDGMHDADDDGPLVAADEGEVDATAGPPAGSGSANALSLVQYVRAAPQTPGGHLRAGMLAATAVAAMKSDARRTAVSVSDVPEPEDPDAQAANRWWSLFGVLAAVQLFTGACSGAWKGAAACCDASDAVSTHAAVLQARRPAADSSRLHFFPRSHHRPASHSC